MTTEIETVTPAQLEAARHELERCLIDWRDASSPGAKADADRAIAAAQAEVRRLETLIETEPQRRQAAELAAAREQLLNAQLVAAQLLDIIGGLRRTLGAGVALDRLAAGAQMIVAGASWPADHLAHLFVPPAERAAELAAEWQLSGAQAEELATQLHLAAAEGAMRVLTTARGGVADLIRAGQRLTAASVYAVLIDAEFPGWRQQLASEVVR